VAKTILSRYRRGSMLKYNTETF